MGETISTRVAIIGGGPAGLTVALELGLRGIDCVLIEDNRDAPNFPKANATTSRSMEHYRRLGIAEAVRGHALPAGYPTDITYLTRYSGYEMARLVGDNLKPEDWRTAHECRWPTSEPLARVQQMNVEKVMRDAVAKCDSVRGLLGWRVEEVVHTSRPLRISARDVSSGDTIVVEADFVVGADGPHSIVRKALGIKYEGTSDFDRDFMGGPMLATYFRSPDFYDVTGELSWQYWAINTEQRGLICALDGRDMFVLYTQMAPGQTGDLELAHKSLELSMGRPFEFEIIGCKDWQAGLALVTEHMADDRADPHVFLIGDAAHLFTPTGGQGYNTAVDDAVNLGWKLAAVCEGWGGAELLKSFEVERQMIARRNTGFARAMAEEIGRLDIPEALEKDSAEGEALRQEMGQKLQVYTAKEFDIPGITYGVFYGGSGIVSGDGTAPPPDEWNAYVPTTVPGARAPHIWVDEDTSIHDLFGGNFTLVRFTQPEAGEDALLAKANKADVFKVVDIDHEAARMLYQSDRVLIRPDQHVAWRGNVVPDDFAKILNVSAGHQ